MISPAPGKAGVAGIYGNSVVENGVELGAVTRRGDGFPRLRRAVHGACWGYFVPGICRVRRRSHAQREDQREETTIHRGCASRDISRDIPPRSVHTGCAIANPHFLKGVKHARSDVRSVRKSRTSADGRYKNTSRFASRARAPGRSTSSTVRFAALGGGLVAWCFI